MCLLILKKKGSTIPLEYIENGMIANSDGIGYSYIENGQIYVEKSLNASAGEIYEKLKPLKDRVVLLHMRFSTVGNRLSEVNTHPHRVGDDWVFGHNGTLDIDTSQYPEFSDTVVFGKTLNPADNFAHPEKIKEIEEKIGLGNKMVFLNKNEEFSICNEKLGHWVDGIWLSNESYRESFIRYAAPMRSNYLQEGRACDILLCAWCQSSPYYLEDGGIDYSAPIRIDTEGRLICQNCFDIDKRFYEQRDKRLLEFWDARDY